MHSSLEQGKTRPWSKLKLMVTSAKIGMMKQSLNTRGVLTLLEPQEICGKSEDVGAGCLGLLCPEIFNDQIQSCGTYI